MRSKSWETAHKKRDDFLSKVIHPILPKARYSSTFMMGTPEKAPNNFKGKLSSKELFKGTKYFNEGKGMFMHYTSLFGVKSILDSGFLRMSEFGSLIDKSELIYGASVFSDNPTFNFSEKKIKEIKDNLFCLSVCRSNDTSKRNSFMWDNYGDKGNGVIIEFEFTKSDPYFYLFGNVQYGKKELAPLKEIKKLSEIFIKDNNGFSPNNFIEFLLEMQSFHKAKKYEVEEEIRVFMREEKQHHKDHDHPTIYKDINSNNEVKYFNKIYLKGRHELLGTGETKDIDDVLDIYPQIEIKNIILGYNLSIENKVNISMLLNDLKEIHGYQYTIQQITNELEIHPMKV